MGIDIGSPAINRLDNMGTNYTIVNKSNPANASGTITSIEIWAYAELANCEVATFYVVSGDNLSTRDTEAIGTVTAGSKQTFGVSLNVEAGDYLGIYFTGGYIERDDTGYAGVWYIVGDYIPCTNVAFLVIAGDTVSLYGTGISLIPITATSNIATSITSSLSRGIKEVLTSTSNIVISTTSVLSRGITETLTSTCNVATSITSSLSRGITEVLTSTANIATSISAILGRGVTETLTSTSNIATSIISTLTKEVKAITSTANIATSIIGKILKDYISLTKSDRTYTSVTKADKVYTPVSDITPSGTVEEKFIWNYINPNYDTWVELLAKEHWCDWYFATPFTDAWSSLVTPTKTYASVTAPSKTYNEVTTPDRTFASITTPASTFTGVSDVTPDGTAEEKFTWAYIDDNFDTWVELLAKEHWCDWYFATKFVDTWTSKTTPSRTYTDVTKPEDGYVSVTTPDKEYKEVTKHQIDV